MIEARAGEAPYVEIIEPLLPSIAAAEAVAAASLPSMGKITAQLPTTTQTMALRPGDRIIVDDGETAYDVTIARISVIENGDIAIVRIEGDVR